MQALGSLGSWSFGLGLLIANALVSQVSTGNQVLGDRDKEPNRTQSL